VAGFTRDKARLALARQLGAACIVDVEENNRAEVVQQETGGMGVDVALGCAGHPDSVRGCLDALRPMGHYTQVAICGREITFPID